MLVDLTPAFAAPALALVLALGPGAPAGDCVALQVTATGRNAHGSAVMPASAPHQLIRALDRLTVWARESDGASEARIVALEAGSAINVIPERASAVVEVSGIAAADRPQALVSALARELGPHVDLRELAGPCGPRR